MSDNKAVTFSPPTGLPAPGAGASLKDIIIYMVIVMVLLALLAAFCWTMQAWYIHYNPR